MAKKIVPPAPLIPKTQSGAIDYERMPNNLLLEELFKYSKCSTETPKVLLSQIVQRISKDYQLIGLDCIKGEGAILAVYNNLGDKICLKIIRPNLSKRQAFDIRNAEDVDEKMDINKYRQRLFEGLKIQRDLLKTLKKNGFKYFSVPEILGVFTQPFLYIAQDWIEGETILKHLNTIKDLAKSLELFKLLLDGVEVNVHMYGVVHRDIKSDNIMISGDTANDPILTLLDWSLAKVITRDNLTVVGEGIGTPLYADYDQLGGKMAIYSTYQNDVYSLGMVLWEFVTCRRIPMLLSIEQLSDPEKRAEYRNILAQDIAPRSLKPIFLKATAEKDERYQTIAEFKDDYMRAICEIEGMNLEQYNVVETKKYMEIDDYGETQAGQVEVIVDSSPTQEEIFDLCEKCEFGENVCKKHKYCNLKYEAWQEIKGR